MSHQVLQDFNEWGWNKAGGKITPEWMRLPEAFQVLWQVSEVAM